MKKKMILSLVMAAALTIGGAGIMTNANFTATATSANNIFNTGVVQLQRGGEQAAQSIQMDKLFNATSMGFDKVATNSASINIRGDFPVTLSAEISNVTLPSDEVYNAGFAGTLTNAFKEINTDARWWRQYKMAVTATVTRNGNVVLKRTSRDITDTNDNYDSFFDTLNGTSHKGSASTRGISEVLTSLGKLLPGDVLTVTTDMKLVSDYENGSGVKIGTLTNEQQNLFQGLSIGADVKITATEVK